MRFFAIIILFFSLIAGVSAMVKKELNDDIFNYLENVKDEDDKIYEARQKMLLEISDFIKEKLKKGEEINLNFICTHNSRRSHMSQLWAAAAAQYYDIKNINTFSGGTEGTAFNPRAVKALRKAGFSIEVHKEGDNPVYHVKYRDDMEPMVAFSKKYEHEANPSENFAAVMVCAEADEACPFVPGADERFAIPFKDPKEFDGTDKEEQMYDERSLQIAREMMFVMRNVVE